MGRPPESARQPADDGFAPIRPNPYIVGNPVRGSSMFFGREAEFDLVNKRFKDSSHGGLLVFCGERRSGKTSILFQILDRRLGPEFIPVLVDMQSMAVTNEMDFLGKIATEILEAIGPENAGVGLPDFQTTSSNSATFQRFVAQVMRQHPNRKLILLFDEYELFENKIEARVLSEDTLHVLANLMEHQSVFIVFTGSQHLEARRHDCWKILGKSIYKRISYLERKDALDLIQKPVANAIHYAEGAVEDIYRLTAGQPFYTQAVCQNLVDWLNENRTREATREAVSTVADGLVENPLPQMIFLWDSLGRDEKLVLALLAETLAGESDFATQRQLERTISSRRYPLDLDASRIAPALEHLFKQEELLLKDDAPTPGYAFRMDLWRRWIRRMHSVWQVMREEGFEIRARPRRKPWVLVPLAAALITVVWVLAQRGGQPATRTGDGAADGSTPAALRITATPPEAVLRVDGVYVGLGGWDGGLAPGSHVVQVGAPGFTDTNFVLQVEAGRDLTADVNLRPLAALRGILDVRTEPPGARIAVDGELRGMSPLVLNLPAGDRLVEATLADHEPVRRRITVLADSTQGLELEFGAPTVSVFVTTDPVGGELSVDGRSLGQAPATASGLAFGQHSFAARLAGWAPLDTTVLVDAHMRQLHLALHREPPGELEVRADIAVRLYIDGQPIGSAHLYNWKVPLAPGSHLVRVVPSAGDTLEVAVQIRPGDKLTYDYSKAGLRPVALAPGAPP